MQTSTVMAVLFRLAQVDLTRTRGLVFMQCMILKLMKNNKTTGHQSAHTHTVSNTETNVIHLTGK